MHMKTCDIQAHKDLGNIIHRVMNLPSVVLWSLKLSPAYFLKLFMDFSPFVTFGGGWVPLGGAINCLKNRMNEMKCRKKGGEKVVYMHVHGCSKPIIVHYI